MNRNYRAQGRSTAHILQLFNKKENKYEADEVKSSDSQESSQSTSSQKNLTENDKSNDL